MRFFYFLEMGFSIKGEIRRVCFGTLCRGDKGVRNNS